MMKTTHNVTVINILRAFQVKHLKSHLYYFSSFSRFCKVEFDRNFALLCVQCTVACIFPNTNAVQLFFVLL